MGSAETPCATTFDVSAVNKDSTRRQIARFCHFAQDPCKYQVYRFRSKPMPEVLIWPLIISSLNCTMLLDMVCCLLSECVW